MRIESGIPGLDDLIEGGFPDPSIILVYGPPGAGKSIMSLQFLMHGASRGEKGLYITTLSEKFEWMARFMSGFDFFQRKYFERGMVVYEDLARDLSDDELGVLQKIKGLVGMHMPKRIVIDPINPLREYMENYREFLFNLVDVMKQWDAVVIMTSEMGRDFWDEMYMADGIIELVLKGEGEVTRRYIKVLKMRGTNHSMTVHPMSVDQSGISVLKANF